MPIFCHVLHHVVASADGVRLGEYLKQELCIFYISVYCSSLKMDNVYNEKDKIKQFHCLIRNSLSDVVHLLTRYHLTFQLLSPSDLELLNVWFQWQIQENTFPQPQTLLQNLCFACILVSWQLFHIPRLNLYHWFAGQ